MTTEPPQDFSLHFDAAPEHITDASLPYASELLPKLSGFDFPFNQAYFYNKEKSPLPAG